jgi:hypothetical protein
MKSIDADLSSGVEVELKGQERDLLAKLLLLGVLGVIVAWVGSTASALGAAVTTRSYDNARTGWNQSETTLNPLTVTPNTFHKIGELRVDDKVETSPLYVAGVSTNSGTRDLIIVATTNNTVYAFDANTNALVWAKSLGFPVQRLKPALYENWGITSTPVIDLDTNTLYVVRLAWEDGNKVYRLFGLRLFDGNEEVQSQAIDGFSVHRNGKFFRNGEQIIRTALGLWKNGAGEKAIVFGAAGGEDVNGANGWVIAYNVGQLRGAGNVTPAVWCSTPNGGGGGVWMAAQGSAIDETDPNRDIYIATGNGPYNQIFGADDLGESVVRLRFDPTANTLNVVDWFTPFTDASHDFDHRDQDLGAAGVLLIPDSQTVLAGGKEGIFYNVNRNRMGKLSHANLLQPDFVGSFTPAAGYNYLANTNQATTTDGVTGASGSDRTFIPHPADGGRTRHIHGGAVYFASGLQRLVYVMGENSTLRAFQYSANTLSTTPIAQSSALTATSGNTAPPGGMPGGFLAVSSSDASGTDGIVWSVSPRRSMWRDPAASEIPVPSILRAFNAIPSGDSISELWNSEIDVRDALGSASKWQPPLVANGRVYVATYNNKVVIYGTTAPRLTPRDIRRTMVLIKGQTEPGQDMFIRGGIDHTYGNSHGRNCPTISTPAFSDPRYYNCAVHIEHRNTINYGGNHEPYAITNRWQINDTYLDWYGREEFQTYQRRSATNDDIGFAQGTPLDWTTNNNGNGDAVIRQGYGFLKENQDAGLGDHYWMLDVDIDCETAINIGGTYWFEVKSFISNVQNGWESDINQVDRPYASGNHFAQCGKFNIFERSSNSVTYRNFDTVNQCSFPNQERRCNGSAAQICRSVSGANVWQDVQDCVQSRQLCQTTTGLCCTPTNGFNGSNRNCL